MRLKLVVDFIHKHLSRTRYWLLAAVALGVSAGWLVFTDTKAASQNANPWASALNVGLLAATFVAILWYSWESRQVVVAMRRQSDAVVYLQVQGQMATISEMWESTNEYPRDWNRWSADQVHGAHTLADSLERVAILAQRALVDQALILAGYAALFHEAWKLLGPFVVEHRRIAGYRRRQYFQDLASESAAWLKRHGLQF